MDKNTKNVKTLNEAENKAKSCKNDVNNVKSDQKTNPKAKNCK